MSAPRRSTPKMAHIQRNLDQPSESNIQANIHVSQQRIPNENNKRITDIEKLAIKGFLALY